MITSSLTTPCTFGYTLYHYKKIAVPEVTINNMPDVRIFYKTGSKIAFYYPPDSGQSWGSGSLYFAEGYVYILFKQQSMACAGTVSSTIYWIDSDYKIVIQR